MVGEEGGGVVANPGEARRSATSAVAKAPRHYTLCSKHVSTENKFGELIAYDTFNTPMQLEQEIFERLKFVETLETKQSETLL
ncbi:hypothetical protein Tco_1254984 [Tanacetum coccineum]